MSEWGKVPREVFLDDRLTRRDLRVLGILCTHADGRTGICTRKQEAIAEEIGSDRSGVNRSIGKLVSLGYVTTHQRAGMKRSLQYRVLVRETTNGQMSLFDAQEAPRQGKPASRKRAEKGTSVVPPESTSVVPSSSTSNKQTPVNRREPVGSLAQPRGAEREVANDRPSEPVPTRTDQQTGAVPSQVEQSAGAVPPVRLNVEAVPFLPILPEAADRSDLDALQDRLEAAASAVMDPTSGTLRDVSAVLRWIAAGCDLERDILPTIAGRAARHKGRGIRSWGYFEQPVLEAREHRLAIAARTAASAPTIIPFDPKGASHVAASRFDSESTGGRFAAAAARRRRGFAGGPAGGEDH